MLFQQAKKHAQAAQDRAKAAQDQVKAAKKVALEAEKDNDCSGGGGQPTPFFFLALRGTTVCESTAAGVSLVLWCAGVGMAVSHVISFWMFLGVCARSSLSGRKSNSPCYRLKV
jgi:hypothetical protein